MSTDSVEPLTELAPAEWLVRAVMGFEGRVRDVVPATYARFARIVAEEGRPVAPLLRDALAQHGVTGRCWFALWDGWPTAEAWPQAPRFHLPHRDFLLFSGDLASDLMVFDDDPRGFSLWWPDDRAWVVANEVDSDATYIAGSASLIGDLLRTEGLDVSEVEPDDQITVDE